MAKKTLVKNIGMGAVWVLVFATCYVAANLLASVTFGRILRPQMPTELLTYRLSIYLLMAALLAGAFWLYHRARPAWADFGMPWWPRWKELGLGLIGVAIYIIGTMIVQYVATLAFGLNAAQDQDLGLSSLYGGEMLVAFVVLVGLTPLFEELLFRGFLYGRLRALVKKAWWLPALIVSALFGLAHGQWNVGLDVFVLSMVACTLREMTGSIWGGVVLHMIKNMVAFMFTFVFINGIGG